MEIEKEVEHRLQLIQQGHLNRGWAFLNQIRARRTEAEIQLAVQENVLADLLLERKDYERQLEAIKYHKSRHLEVLKVQYEEVRIQHEKAELDLKFLKHEYDKTSREFKHVERQMEAIEQVLKVAARKGLDIETYKYGEKKKIKTQSKLYLLTAKNEHELKVLDAKLNRDLQRLDKKGQVQIAHIIAETDQQLRVVEKQHRQAIDLLQIESKIRINELVVRETIEIEKRRLQIEQDMDAADRIDLTPLILYRKSHNLLNEAFRERRVIEQAETDPVLRQQLLINKDVEIKRLQGEVYGKGNGLVLPADGDEEKKLLPPPDGGTTNRKKSQRAKKRVSDKGYGLGGRW